MIWRHLIPMILSMEFSVKYYFAQLWNHVGEMRLLNGIKLGLVGLSDYSFAGLLACMRTSRNLYSLDYSKA